MKLRKNVTGCDVTTPINALKYFNTCFVCTKRERSQNAFKQYMTRLLGKNSLIIYDQDPILLS